MAQNLDQISVSDELSIQWFENSQIFFAVNQKQVRKLDLISACDD